MNPIRCDRCPIQRANWAYILCLAILLLAFLGWGITHEQKFVRDDDEGMNLMKAQSVRAGYALYRDIWSDQPPLFTLLLAVVFNIFGPSVSAGRMLVLAFALLALLSNSLISRHIAGRIGSLASVLFLLTSDRFDSLALSIRIDLPAIALSSLAVLFTLRYLRTGKRAWLLLMGVAFFSGLMIKPLGAYLAIPIALALVLRARRLPSRRWRDLACDLGLLALMAAAVLIITLAAFDGQAMLGQIVGTELRSQHYYSREEADTLERLATHLRDAGWPYWGQIALAIWGGFTLRTARRRSEALVILAVLFCTGGVLMMRVPLRRRYLLLLSVPLSVLGGAAVDDALHRVRGYGTGGLWKSLSLGLAAFALVGVGWRINHLISSVRAGDQLGMEAVEFIVQNTSPQAYIICDEGMITFRSGRRTPPSLSVISGRRIKTGGLTVGELITTTQVYRPEAIVLWEDKLSTLPEYVAWVKAHYHPARVYDDRHQIFLLKSTTKARGHQVPLIKQGIKRVVLSSSCLCVFVVNGERGK